MTLPVVAIVGRPNVGKSSLLNNLTGKMISIVEPTPGVTRDRVSAPCQLAEDRYVELVDTGGMGADETEGFHDDVEGQIEFAVAAAELVLFVVDARDGVMALDRHVAEKLRRTNKPVLLLANKVDSAKMQAETAEMLSLGFGEPMLVSAAHGLGRREVLDAIAERLGDRAGPLAPSVMKLAIVGKRNAGKSTFINALCGQERCIVSEIPGTTRDSVDVDVELDGRHFVVIDTAGIRKTKKLDGDIEFYSQHRAMLSIRRADVIALMIDASVKVSQVDKDLAGKIALEMKPVLIVVSKWDLAREKATGEDYAGYLAKTFPELAFAPISLTSAHENLNVRQTVTLAEDLFKQASTRIPTALLNETIEKITEMRVPSHKVGTKAPKILYASQIGTCPPTIVCFVNDVGSFGGEYQRFLLNQFRDRLPFTEVPINLILRQRRGESRKAWGEARKGQGLTPGGEPRRTPTREPVRVVRRVPRGAAGAQPGRKGISKKAGPRGPLRGDAGDKRKRRR
jgi:GTP-binding protein